MKKLAAKDRYLRKRFGITLEEYDSMLYKQRGVCKICGAPPKTISLSVDHDHAVERWIVKSHKVMKGLWKAYPADQERYGKLAFTCEGKTKPQARARVKEKLRRISIRSLLCFRCNMGLQKFQDDPVTMKKASEYLDKYYGWLNGQLEGEDFNDRNT